MIPLMKSWYLGHLTKPPPSILYNNPRSLSTRKDNCCIRRHRDQPNIVQLHMYCCWHWSYFLPGKPRRHCTHTAPQMPHSTYTHHPLLLSDAVDCTSLNGEQFLDLVSTIGYNKDCNTGPLWQSCADSISWTLHESVHWYNTSKSDIACLNAIEKILRTVWEIMWIVLVVQYTTRFPYMHGFSHVHRQSPITEELWL